MKKLFLSIKEKFGNIEVLINNAAYVRAKKFGGDYSKEDWQYNLEGTVVSLDICTQEAVKQMKENKKRTDNKYIFNVWDEKSKRVYL